MNFPGYAFLGPYGWITLSIVTTAAYVVLTSAYMRRYHYVSLHYTVAVTHGFAALLLLAFIDHSPGYFVVPQLWRYLVAVAVLTWIAKMFYYYAYSRNLPAMRKRI